MNKEQSTKLKNTKLKAFMMRNKNHYVELTKEELELLAEGSKVFNEDELSAILMKMRVPDYLEVTQVVRNCCKYSIMFFEVGIRSTADEVIDKITELDRHYRYVLQYIKPIKVVEEQVAYNSKLN